MDVYTLALATLGGLGIASIFYALAVPRRRIQRAQAATLLEGIQVRLDHASLAIPASRFLWQGAALGLALGLLAAAIVGTPAVIWPFLAGGYLLRWAHGEDQRNQRINRYHHDLAGAMGIIVNAWRNNPALSTALESVVGYGPGSGEGPEKTVQPGSVAADFDDLLRALRAGTPLRQALQTVADRRRSPIFDGLATALLVAEEQGSQAGQLLERQAAITHRQVEIFHETISRQQAARGEIRNGSFGPWVILGLVRLLSAAGAGGMDMAFFQTPAGMLAAILAALTTVGIYAASMRLASRGLLLQRVATEYSRERAG